MEIKKITFNFYGVKVCVCGYSAVAEKISGDFEYFKDVNLSVCDINLNVNLVNPPYEKVPKICASMYKNDCISYDSGFIRYVDYSGKALAIYDTKTNSADFFSIDEDLLYEIVYLFIHSRTGELLDKKGMHRIHACSFSYNEKICIVMLPQGGGKSTLLMELLKNSEIKLISDDTPFVDSKGQIYPFPIRIGVSGDVDTEYIPSEYMSIFNRRKFGLKKLIGYQFFKNRIETKKYPVIIICGMRCFSDDPFMGKGGIFTGFSYLFKNCIVGYGLPQVLEYFLIGGFKDNFSKIKIIFSRCRSCINLLMKNRQIYCFRISNKKSENAEYLLREIAKL